MFQQLAFCLALVSTAALAQPRLVVNTGHTDDVTSVVLSSDRTLALTASKDQTARIWDMDSGRELRRMAEHDDWVNAAVFSPDDRFVATGTEDAVITIYSATDGQTIRKMATDGRYIISIGYTPDGKRIVSADGNGDITIWSTENGAELQRFNVDAWISAMALSPDGKFAVVGAEEGKLALFALGDGQRLRTFEGHKGDITAVAFGVGGSVIISASDGGNVIVWDVASGQARRMLSAETVEGWPEGNAPTAIAVSPDGRLFLIGHESGYIGVFSATDFSRIGGGQAHEDARINGLAFSSDGTAVVSGAEHGEAVLWSTETGDEIRAFEGRVDSVEAIAIHPDGRSLAAGSGYLDTEVSGWSLDAGVNIGRLAGDSGVWSLDFSPDGDLLAYTFDGDTVVDFWNATTEENFQITSPFHDESTALAFSPDGRYLLAYSQAHAGIWDLETRLPVPGPAGSFALPIHGGQFIEESSYRDDSGQLVTEQVVYDLGRASAAWSPDGRYVAMGISNEWREPNPETNQVHVRRIDTGEWIEAFDVVEDGVNALQFSPDGRSLVAASNGSASIIDLQSGEETRLDHDGAVLNTAIWMPDGRHVVTGGRDRLVRVWDVSKGVEIRRFEGHTSQVNALRLLKGGEIIVSASKDGTIRVWDNVHGGEIGQLVSFGGNAEHERGDGESRWGGEWAVIDPEGRFDASNGGDVDGLHWVVNDEVVALSQLKDRFYEPGLLAKLLGFNPEPLRDVSNFAATGAALFPEVEIVHAPDTDDPVLRFTVINRGGGIGPVQVLINGKEVTEDARPAGTDPRAPSIDLSLDLDGHPFLRGDTQNRIEFVTANAEQSLTSRGIGITISRDVTPVADKPAEPPRIWAVAVGVSDYSGSDIDLSFADKDAASFAAAIELAARGLVSPDRVSVRLINGDPVPATRSTLQQALEEIAGKASSSDILILYLAGHGVTFGGSDSDYYYVMQDATSLDISDPGIRARVAISSQELTELINSVPALKQVLILDTCASGQLISDLVSSRGVSSAQMRSIERMKDRTGMFILAGSAADAVSYEATPYGQGLLTYSLLEGMRGPALREASYVDVDRLFGFATDRVQSLARGLGGVQQPRVSDPQTGSFDIGLLSPADQARIQVATPKPVVISSMFQDQERIRDYLGLGAKVDASLRDAAAAQDSRFVFFSAQTHPTAYSLAGRYQVSGDSIQVTVVMSRGDTSADRFSVTGTTNDLPALQTEIVHEMQSRLR